jgi:catechol 2,3-dioxygenase-like lactoylglutathione lyase family enzyme
MRPVIKRGMVHTRQPQIVRPPALEEMHIAGMIDNAGEIRVLVIDPLHKPVAKFREFARQPFTKISHSCFLLTALVHIGDMFMLLYITLGTNDLERSRAFYDPVMTTLGFARHVTHADEIGYGPALPVATPRQCFFWVTVPYLKLPATWGNGTLIALPASIRADVDAFHAAAITNGGTDDGAPGLRPYHANFYACYVRDPDGNKLSAVCEVED